MLSWEVKSLECIELFKNDAGENVKAEICAKVKTCSLRKNPQKMRVDVDFTDSPIASDNEAVKAVTDEANVEMLQSVLAQIQATKQPLPEHIGMAIRISDSPQATILSTRCKQTATNGDVSQTLVEVVAQTLDGIVDWDATVHMHGEFNPGLMVYYTQGEDFRRRLSSFAINENLLDPESDREMHLIAPTASEIYMEMMQDESEIAGFCREAFEEFEREGWDGPAVDDEQE